MVHCGWEGCWSPGRKTQETCTHTSLGLQSFFFVNVHLTLLLGWYPKCFYVSVWGEKMAFRSISETCMHNNNQVSWVQTACPWLTHTILGEFGNALPPQEEYIAIPVSQIWGLRPREVNLAKIHNNLVNSRVHICFLVFPSVPSFFVFSFLFVLKHTWHEIYHRNHS